MERKKLEVIANFINDYPVIYRTMRAINYMKENPLRLIHRSSKKEQLIKCSEYICLLINLFFSNCGLSFSNDDDNNQIKEDRYEIIFETSFTECDTNLNFSLFLTFLKEKITNAFYNAELNIPSVDCFCENESIMVSIYFLEHRFNNFKNYQNTLIKKTVKNKNSVNI